MAGDSKLSLVGELAQALSMVSEDKQESVATLLLGVVQGVLLSQQMGKEAG